MPSATPRDFSTWIRARRQTLRGIAIGTTTWASAFGAAWSLWPPLPAMPSGGRVAYALQLAAVPAVLTLLMVCACFRLFDTAQAEDPLAGSESQRFRVNQRVLTNTVEQAAAFVPIILALATRLPPAQLKLLPIAVLIWSSGRLLFWGGYHLAPHWRAPGFDWTFYTTALLAAWYVAIEVSVVAAGPG